MTHVLGLLALVAVLFLGSGGWGRVVVALCRRAGWEGAAGALGPPLQVALGMSLFLVVGGVLVAADVARVGVLIGWHLVGCVLVARPLARRVLEWARGTRRVLVVGGAVVMVVALLVLIALGNVFGTPYNGNDDFPGYIYLTKRLLATGGLIDPFNLRRITSYGGSQLYQSLFLRVSGYSALRAFEFLFSPLLLVALVVGSSRRRWFVGGALVVGLALFVADGLGPPLLVSNLSPAFSAAALSLVVFQLTGLLQRPEHRGERPLYVLIGLSLAGLLALRFTFVITAGIAAVIGLIALRGRERLVGPALTIATVVAGSVGWAVASMRSSGTPFFVLVAGNYNRSWPPIQNPAVHALSAYVIRFRKAFTYDQVGLVMVACMLVAILVAARSASARGPALALAGAAVGALVQLGLLTVQLTGADFPDIVRFEGPGVLAGALYAVSILWPTRASTESGVPSPDAAPSARPPGLVTGGAGAVGVVVLVVAIVVLAVGHDVVHKARLLKQEVDLGAHVVDGTAGFGDPFGTPVRQAYDRLNALVPRGAKVLAAVEDPELLAFSRYTFATLDEVGAASPPPYLPLWRGPQPVARYLRALGYRYVVVDAPTAFGLYNTSFWAGRLHNPVWSTRHYARYFLQWQRIVDALEHDGRPVSHAGSLTLISLP